MFTSFNVSFSGGIHQLLKVLEQWSATGGWCGTGTQAWTLVVDKASSQQCCHHKTAKECADGHKQIAEWYPCIAGGYASENITLLNKYRDNLKLFLNHISVRSIQCTMQCFIITHIRMCMHTTTCYLSSCPTNTKAQCCQTLVRLILDYASTPRPTNHSGSSSSLTGAKCTTLYSFRPVRARRWSPHVSPRLEPWGGHSNVAGQGQRNMGGSSYKS